MQYVSLRELRERLLYLRQTHPQSDSEWARIQVVQDTVGGLNQRAMEALRDAVEANPIQIHDVVTSEAAGAGVRAIPLPPRVSQVLRVNVQTGTDLADGLELKHWRYEPQSATPRLHLDDASAAPTPLNIHYVHVPQRLPLNDLRVATCVTSGATTVYTTGVPDPTTFTYPGYLELSTPFANTATREVLRYSAVSNTGFRGCTRAVQGLQCAWTQGALVSYVIEMPSGYYGVVSRHAQATLFEYLLQDRALYPVYAAAAGERAAPAEELAAMVGLLRSLAKDDRRKITKRSQSQTRGTRKRRM